MRRQYELEESKKFKEFLNYVFDQYEVTFTGLGYNFYVGDVLIARKLSGFYGTKYLIYHDKIKLDTSEPHKGGWDKELKKMMDKIFNKK